MLPTWWSTWYPSIIHVSPKGGRWAISNLPQWGRPKKTEEINAPFKTDTLIYWRANLKKRPYQHRRRLRFNRSTSKKQTLYCVTTWEFIQMVQKNYSKAIFFVLCFGQLNTQAKKVTNDKWNQDHWRSKIPNVINNFMNMQHFSFFHESRCLVR